jgi:hypothetical protein
LAAHLEPVPETKKVMDFLGRIMDPSLGARLANIYGDREKLVSFRICQQYLSTIVTSTNIHKRNLQAMCRATSLGETDRGSGSHKKPKLEARDYPLHQWKRFLPDEQKKIQQLRFKKKTNKYPPSSDKGQKKARARGHFTFLASLVKEKHIMFT